MSVRPRLGYPSDLSETQWARLQPLLPEPQTVGRHRVVNPREVANAINYRWETGCVWRMLPHDFPPWGTVYAYFRHWQRAGVIRHLREILLEPRPKSQPRPVVGAPSAQPSWPSADSPQDRTLAHRNPVEPQRPVTADEGFSAPIPESEHFPQVAPRAANFLD